MNKKILLLLIFLTTLTCSAKTEKSIPEQRLEGWAGNPDNPNEKPFDYFYMRSKGRGNEKAFKKKYGALLPTHPKCGAIVGACNHVEMGNLTTLLNKIQPAIFNEKKTKENRNGSNADFVNNVTEINVHLTIDRVRRESPIIAEMEDLGQIKIVGGLYDVETGEVNFYE